MLSSVFVCCVSLEVFINPDTFCSGRISGIPLSLFQSNPPPKNPKIHPADQMPRMNQTFITYLKYQTSGKQDTERRCLTVLQLLPVAVPREVIHRWIDWMKISACVVPVICSGCAPIGCWAVALCLPIGRPLGSSCGMAGSDCFLPVAFILAWQARIAWLGWAWFTSKSSLLIRNHILFFCQDCDYECFTFWVQEWNENILFP